MICCYTPPCFVVTKDTGRPLDIWGANAIAREWMVAIHLRLDQRYIRSAMRVHLGILVMQSTCGQQNRLSEPIAKHHEEFVQRNGPFRTAWGERVDQTRAHSCVQMAKEAADVHAELPLVAFYVKIQAV